MVAPPLYVYTVITLAERGMHPILCRQWGPLLCSAVGLAYRSNLKTMATQSLIRTSLRGILIVLLAFLAAQLVKGQSTNMVYEQFDISPDPLNFLHSDIDAIPGSSQFLVSGVQSFPAYIIDEQHQVEATLDIGNWYAGSRISISPTGEHFLLQQLFYLDFSPNKDREVKFQVVERSNGQEVLKIPEAHSAKFHPNGKELIVLIGDEVWSYPLGGGGNKKLFPVIEATNCVAISPDGSKIAVSHKVEDAYLEDYVTKKRQKKNYKIYKKYRQCISVYSANDLQRLYTVDEMFDIPYLLEFTPDGKHLLCYSVPQTQVVAKTGMTGSKYISKINAETGAATTVGFVSNATYEPDVEFSNNGKYLALSTNTGRFPEAWVADLGSGDLVARFQLATRMFEGMKKGEYPSDGRLGLAFSNDDQYLYITAGSRIVKWQIPYEDE